MQPGWLLLEHTTSHPIPFSASAFRTIARVTLGSATSTSGSGRSGSTTVPGRATHSSRVRKSGVPRRSPSRA
jgi:hypothetical protein